MTEPARDRSARYSPSRLGVYKTCPRQYRFRYVDRIAVDTQSVEAFLGSCVHAGLEELYEGLMHGKRMTEDEVVGAFAKQWDSGFGDKIVLRDARYAPADWRRMGEECVRLYYREQQPFDRDRTVAVEKRVGFPVEVKDPSEPAPVSCRVEGFVDRLAFGRDGAFEIHDYKTGKSLPTQAELDEDWQLAIYELAVREAWPDTKKVRLLWHYVRHGKTLVSERTPDQLAALRGEIARLIAKIRSDRAFEPVRSALCDWCDYRALCPLFKHPEALARLPAELRRADEGAASVDAYAALEARRKRLREESSELEAEEEKLKALLVDFARKNGVSTVAGSAHEVDVHEKEEFRFPTRSAAPEKVERMEEALQATPAWKEVSRLDPKALMEAYLSGGLPEAASRLVEGWLGSWIRRETVSTVRLRRKKDEDE